MGQLECELLLSQLGSLLIQQFALFRQEVLARLPGFVDADVFVVWKVRKLRYSLSASDSPDSRADAGNGELSMAVRDGTPAELE